MFRFSSECESHLGGNLTTALFFFMNHALTKKHRIKTFFRILNWQFTSRLASKPTVIDWINGSRFYASRGETGVTGNIYAGLHEFEDMGFLLHFLQPTDYFIDVGANSGSYTILASKVAGSRVLSIEPVPQTFSRLVKNLELNSVLGGVEALNIGLGRKSGILKFSANQDTMNHIVADNFEGSTVEVTISTLDELASKLNPILLKIDVEGFELEVLEGAKSILEQPHLLAIIIELNGSGKRYGYSDSDCMKILSANGFDAFKYSPFDRSLKKILSMESNQGNVLFIRNVSEAERRVRLASKFKVLDQLI